MCSDTDVCFLLRSLSDLISALLLCGAFFLCSGDLGPTSDLAELALVVCVGLAIALPLKAEATMFRIEALHEQNAGVLAEAAAISYQANALHAQNAGVLAQATALNTTHCMSASLLMMMSVICSFRNKNEPTAIYPPSGYSPPRNKEAHVKMRPP
jgi:hypothetical protein